MNSSIFIYISNHTSGLSHGNRAYASALHHGGQVFILLLFSAVMQDVGSYVQI